MSLYRPLWLALDRCSGFFVDFMKIVGIMKSMEDRN
jgi:hypothetical protein